MCVAVLVGLGATTAGLTASGHSDPSSGSRSRHRAATAAAAVTGFDVRRENALPGVRGWRIPAAAGSADGLSAYAGAVSASPGQTVPLHASGMGTVQVRALRIGWYGGAGARQVWHGTLNATPGPADPASWPVSGAADTTGWPPGHYLLRLDLGAASRYVPLTVRSPHLRDDVVLITSPLTWQAENSSGPGGGATVSYDRPYAQGYGAGSFLAADAPVVQLAERDGEHLAYTTDLDLASRPAAVDGVAALAFGSASQYWTAALRTAVISAIGSGTNAAFFGAGTGTRRVEVATGGRSLVVQQAVPAPTATLTGLTPICPPSAGPLPEPALGARSWVVQDATWWGYREADVSAGQRFPGLVSTGADGGVTAPGTTPAGTAAGGRTAEVLAQSPGACDSTGPTGRGAGPATGLATGPQQAVYWSNSAGAGVFSAGTSRWACVSLGTCPGPAVDRASRAFAAQVTRTVLIALAQPRAARAHPATP